MPFAQIEYVRQSLFPSLEGLKDLHKNETILLRNKWQLNKDNLHSTIKSKGLDINSLEAQQLINNTANINPWLLCNSHVMIEVLAIGFQYGILTNNKNATAERLSSYLRGAIDKTDLYQTQLCQSIFTWQTNNPPYQVLL